MASKLLLGNWSPLGLAMRSIIVGRPESVRKCLITAYYQLAVIEYA